MYLFFDTETTGLPRNWRAPVTDINNWPRMIQIAWILSDEKGNILDQADHIIRPEGFTIPDKAAAVHRITTEIALNEGKDLKTILHTFNELIDEAQYLVAHNISFDEKIVGAEFVRKNLENQLFAKPRLCTMLASTDYCRIPSGNGYGYKWPKLSELHYKLFGVDFEDAHNAAADIEATAKCFWKMKEIGLV